MICASDSAAPAFCYHCRSNALTEIRVRDAEYGALQHAGLPHPTPTRPPSGVHIVAAADHEVLGPANDAYVAVAIDVPQIAGFEPAIRREFAMRFFRIPQ